MLRIPAVVFLLAAATLTVHAHFVFIVPDPQDTAKAVVVFSDSLDPDENISVEKLAPLKLTCRDAAGKDVAVELKAGKHELMAAIPGSGPRMVFGTLNYGVLQKGDSKPYLLAYHPKAIIGAVAADQVILGAKVLPVELAPVVSGSGVKFRFDSAGKPTADVAVTVLKPDGEAAKTKTDKDGFTETFPAKGRYGAWAKDVMAKPGEHAGKKYDEVRHYATLVVDLNARQAQNDRKPTGPLPAFSPMPDGIASFGAAIDGGWLYVYGGHTGKTHTYSRQQSSSRFQRISLKQGGGWEELPSGPGLQGLVLLAHEGHLYRIGGMTAKNEPGEKDDLYSVSDFARFDPKTKKWTDLAPLPEGRSSHGAVVVNNKLYVVGGWDLRGAMKETRWHTDALVFDLAAEKPEWKVMAKPSFERRAMAATAYDGKIYITGGLSSKGGISKDVEVFDIKSEAWAKGPEIPGIPMNGNGLAACGTEKALYLSGMDGKVYRLNNAKDGWDTVGKLEPPRIHHRLLNPSPAVFIAVGGATRNGNLKSVDVVTLDKE